MIKIAFTLLSLFLFNTAFSQIDGTWQGVLIQDNNDGTSSNYSIWVNIKSEGDKLTGSLRSEQVSTPYFKVSEILGKKEGEVVRFEEKTIINHNTQVGFTWSLIVASLKYNTTEGQLKGEYSSIDELCVCLLYTSPSPRDGLLSRMP